MKKILFVRRFADVFFNAFLFGLCFSFGALIVTDHPLRSFACILICMAMTSAMALLYVRMDRIVKRSRIEKREMKKAA